MSKTPERFLWAASLLKIEPHQEILEIGCGVGLLAELICSKLTNGHYTAVDKSAPIIKKAQMRNHDFIKAGKASFIISEFSEASLPSSFYDTITAFNVNFFWKDQPAILIKLKNALKPYGKLYIFYQAPFEINIHDVDPVKQNLLKASFEIIEIQTKKLTPTSAICISAGL